MTVLFIILRTTWIRSSLQTVETKAPGPTKDLDLAMAQAKLMPRVMGRGLVPRNRPVMGIWVMGKTPVKAPVTVRMIALDRFSMIFVIR